MPVLELRAQLAGGSEPLRDHVVVVDRLEVDLSGEEEVRVVERVRLECPPQRQPHRVLDEARVRVRLLDDGDFLFSRQVNFETIHDHEVLAERFGTVGELRAELENGRALPRHTELRDWLAG